MHSKLIAIFTIVLSMVSYTHGGAAITAPVESQWPAGSTQMITWADNGDGKPIPAKVDLVLMSGKMTALQLVKPIASQTDGSSGQYKWDIPKDIAPGKQYAVRIGPASNPSYSAYFEILAADGSSSGNLVSGHSNDGHQTLPYVWCFTMFSILLLALGFY
ncbi:hypothetical protein K7432_006891 [Basidiobolus ranarum]|uniref:Yeast cell wall synthesis Kre9/Knh1-like N-terminal domain-containing protein n=1 Tax=Basidiobolus ranarum TaxID=34480 RepID=A0ABR2W0X1_9FUNG